MKLKRTNKYRIYPTKSQETRLQNWFSMCRALYNMKFEERETTYQNEGRSVSYNEQQNSLPQLKKERPWYKDLHSQVLQNVLRRLDNAFQAFFRYHDCNFWAPLNPISCYSEGVNHTSSVSTTVMSWPH